MVALDEISSATSTRWTQLNSSALTDRLSDKLGGSYQHCHCSTTSSWLAVLAMLAPLTVLLLIDAVAIFASHLTLSRLGVHPI